MPTKPKTKRVKGVIIVDPFYGLPRFLTNDKKFMDEIWSIQPLHVQVTYTLPATKKK